MTMHAEAVFLVAYAIVLVAAAAGLERLGRRPTDPLSSRMLTASRPVGSDQPDSRDWPHSEVPQFHLGLSAVALTAALVISVASLVRHHTVAEVVVHLVILAVAGAHLVRLGARARQPVDHGPFPQPAGGADGRRSLRGSPHH